MAELEQGWNIALPSYLGGRRVEYIGKLHEPIPIQKCADCEKPAIYIIVEKSRTHDKGVFNSAWYYCGICAVG